METDESQVSVWVCREEKLVSGLSRRTTCADVVKVLLDEQATLTGGAHTYCIVEKWRGFERVLPNKTKILRLWSAWGDEQENVRFVLVKSDAASLPHNGPRSAEARVVLSRESPCAARAALPYSQEKQRRIVRKAFRKLDKINRKKEEALRDTSSVEKMETLVHLIISQDHTIRQQVQRIKDLDGEIEKCEAKVHVARVKLHGVNYVQDTYLLEQGVEGEEQLEEYAACCERVLQLQEELTEREALMEILTAEIQEELNQRWMKRRQEETPGQDPESIAEEPVTVSSDLQLEEERIKTQLDTSLYIGLRLDTDLETVKSDLDVSRELLDAKEKELRELLEKVHRLDELEEPRGEEEGDAGGVGGEEVWVEQARGLSKTHNSNDEDSDTGLSSMHSQDSDNTPVCESLV